MIGIKLDGDTDFLQVNEDTSIEITLENPLLGDAEKLSPGSYSLPFTLPGGEKSPTNARKLKHPDVIENSESYQIQKADLFFDDVPFKSGNLKADQSNNNDIESYFTFGLNSISQDLKAARLRDLLNENIVIHTTGVTKEIDLLWIGSAPSRSITVNGKEYTGVGWPAILGGINNDGYATKGTGQPMPYAEIDILNANYLSIKLVQYPSFGAPTTVETNPILLLSVEVDIPANYTIISVGDSDGSMVAYWNAFKTFMSGYITGSYPNDKIRFPVVFNANLYDGEAKKSGELINAVNASGLIVNDLANGKNLNSLQPFLMFKYVLETIGDFLGVGIEGDFYDDPDTATRLIDNSQTLDIIHPYLSSNKVAWWRRDFNLNELIPDISITDFLKGIASRYNLGVTFNETTNKIRLKYREEVAKSKAYDDISLISSPIGPIKDQRTAGYRLVIKAEDGDKLSVEESITIGTGEEEIPIGCGRLHGIGITGLDSALVAGPRVSRKNGDKFGLRVFHYTGLKNNGLYSYPSADIIGANSEYLNSFTDSVGLYSRCFRYWLMFKRNSRLISLKVNWPFRSLLRFDWELKRRFDRSDFLVKSIKVTMTKTGLNGTDVYLLTMK
jgi:hypothetical protein